MVISEPHIYFPRKQNEGYHNKKHCNGKGCVIHCIWSKCIVMVMCHFLIDATNQDFHSVLFASHRHNDGLLKRHLKDSIC